MFDINHCSHEGYESIDGGDYLYDTYDQIIDTNEWERDQDPLDRMGAEEIGLAFALGDEIREEFVQEIDLDERVDIDEDTDRQNFEQVTNLLSLQSRYNKGKNLRPFEQYVDDICKGRRPLFTD
jgi:hypothetical protein